MLMFTSHPYILVASGDATVRSEPARVEGLIQVTADRFKLLHVSEDCDIATLLKKHGFTLQPGGVFYEFTRLKEKITEEKEVILMDKVYY